MGCTQSQSAETTLSHKLDGELRHAREKEAARVKLLLLGAGESGKTTFLNQFRVLHGDGFTKSRLRDMRAVIHRRLLTDVKEVIRASAEGIAGRPLEGDALDAAQRLLAVPESSELTEESAAAIALLWEDDNFRATWEGRSAYQVVDSWGAFAAQCHKFPEWGGPSWMPSVSDAILTRVRTVGIVVEDLVIDGVNFSICDMGGQLGERRKWIHAFSEVTGILFVAAISEYDQKMLEDSSKNRLVDALDLFKDTANKPFFKSTTLILFLNKSDLFRHKLCERKVPLNQSGLFPDAPDTFEYEEGLAWIKAKFRAQTKHKVYLHVTMATDTRNVEVVFNSCRDAILSQSLKDIGLLKD